MLKLCLVICMNDSKYKIRLYAYYGICLFLFLFLHAKLVNLFYKKMKKLYFLTFFLFVSLFAFSQKTVEHKVNQKGGVLAEMQTNYGKIVVKLYDETPLHRDNFIKLVQKGVYDGLLFHRVINICVKKRGANDVR